MTFIKKLPKKYHPRLFEIMSIHIDNYLEIKKNGLTKELLDEFINNIKESGPVGIKMVQWAACNSNYLNGFLNNINNINLDGLKIVHDNCEQQDVDDIIDRIKEDYDDFDESQFNKEPLGIGSIAQVHKYGSNIIKVRHEDVEDIIEEDLNIFKEIVKLGRDDNLEDFFAVDYFKIVNMIDINVLVKELKEQVDLTKEASNIEKVAEQDLGNKVKIPNVIFSTENILIEEFIKGVNINKITEKDKIIKYKIETLVIFLKMINSGYVHADLHEGNILYDEEEIGLIDFGIIKILKDSERENLKKLLNIVLEFFSNDTSDIMDPIEFSQILMLALCPEMTEKDAKLLTQRVVISLGLKGQKKLDKKDLPKIIDLVHSYLLKKGFLINDNMAYCLLTFLLIEGNVSEKYEVDLHLLLIDHLKKENLLDLI